MAPAQPARAAPRRQTRKPPPRRRASSPPILRVRWDRVGRVSLLIVLSAVLGLYVNQANVLWREGGSRLAAADPLERPALQRVIDAIVAELRRRLGGPFTRNELAAIYAAQGTEWCFEIATRAAPGTPAAWDLATVAA